MVARGEVADPVEVRRLLGEALAIDAVVAVVRIAQLHALERDPGERGLDLHDLRRFERGFRFRPAHEAHHLRDVLLVLPADRLHLLVVLQVVIAVGKSQAALVGRPDHLLRVLEVLLRDDAEEGRRPAVVEPSHQLGEGSRVARLVHLVEHLVERLQRGGLRLVLVHASCVEVADLLGVRVGRVRLAARVGLHDLPEDRLVVLEDAGERPAPGRAIARDGVVLQPVAAGELVEVLAGIDRRIHRRLVDAHADERRNRFASARLRGQRRRRARDRAGRCAGAGGDLGGILVPGVGLRNRCGSRACRLGLRRRSRRAGREEREGDQLLSHPVHLPIIDWPACAGRSARGSSRIPYGTRAGCCEASAPNAPRRGSRAAAIPRPAAAAP